VSGSNKNGQLGLGQLGRTFEFLPLKVSAENVFAGPNQSFLIKGDKVLAFGDNRCG